MCHSAPSLPAQAEFGDLARLISQAIKQSTPLPPALVWRYGTQICDALRYMHERRVMHRDVKPANVFVTAALGGGSSSDDGGDGRIAANAFIDADHCMKLGDLGLGRYFSSKTHEARQRPRSAALRDGPAACCPR